MFKKNIKTGSMKLQCPQLMFHICIKLIKHLRYPHYPDFLRHSRIKEADDTSDMDWSPKAKPKALKI